MGKKMAMCFRKAPCTSCAVSLSRSRDRSTPWISAPPAPQRGRMSRLVALIAGLHTRVQI